MARIPQNVLRLGWVSLLNDISSEALTRMVPLYAASVLQAPMSAIGLIEGLADSTSTLLKPYFGRLSDRLRRRKDFVLWGYAFSALARPFLSIAASWPELAFLRFCDRVGKGVRTAPRDALLADSTVEGGGGHGRSFGINRAMDTAGALISVTGFALWLHFHGDTELTQGGWRMICLGLSVPGILALAVVALGVKEAKQTPLPRSKTKAAPLPAQLRRYFAVIGVFALANSSDAFILLRARELGYSALGILGLVALTSVVGACSALPASAWSDRVGRRNVLALGWTIYAACYAVLGTGLVSDNGWLVAAVLAIYGLFYGFTESVERAWIADLAPAQDRGRAYGIFGLIAGLIALPASLAFGWAWESWGSSVPFLASAAIAMFATALLFVYTPHSSTSFEKSASSSGGS
jgi:MFS family permease